MARNPDNPRGPYRKATLEQRIARRINANGPLSALVGGRCWEWDNPDGNGYGSLVIEGKRVMAHRLAYELHVGPIPDGLSLDHLCRNRRCVNPAHLEPVTHRENVARGEAPTARVVRSNVCMKGHELTAENTIIRKGGGRRCRRCFNDAQIRGRRRRKGTA